MINTINGIDVSECGFRCWKHNVNELIENYCAIFNNKCICNPDCYFKHLNRLQEENERLKKRQITKNGFICDCEQNAKYKQALEEIREILMCKIYGLNENASQLDYMCCALDKFEKIRIKILTKINEVLNEQK